MTMMLLQVLLICICCTAANAQQNEANKDRLAIMYTVLPAVEFIESMKLSMQTNCGREVGRSVFDDQTGLVYALSKLKNTTETTLQALQNLNRETLYEALKCKFESVVDDAEYFRQQDTKGSDCDLAMKFGTEIYAKLARAILKITDELASDCDRQYVTGFLNYLQIHSEQLIGNEHVINDGDEAALQDLKTSIISNLTLLRDGLTCIRAGLPKTSQGAWFAVSLGLLQYIGGVNKLMESVNESNDLDSVLHYRMPEILRALLNNTRTQVKVKGP